MMKKDKIKDIFIWLCRLFCFIGAIVAVFVFAIPNLANECLAKESKKHIATITEYENSIIGDDAGGIIDFTDPETGVCYFIYKDGYHGMGQGGMTVRYNADGSIMVRDINVFGKIEEEGK